ncbi:MAG: hypothetical protein ACP5G7_08830, partial [Anaerolineae bacterium]
MNRAASFARRITSRARPLAPTTAERRSVPAWIQRAREDTARLEARTIRPTARPIATLQHALPGLAERVEPTPDLVLARPTAAPVAEEEATETPLSFQQPVPEPAPAPSPFRVADLRERLAPHAEATQPPPTPQQPSVARRAISRVEEKPPEQVAPSEGVPVDTGPPLAAPSDIAPDETGPLPAAPTDAPVRRTPDQRPSPPDTTPAD